MGYSKAPEQPQSNARPICNSHAMTSTRSPYALLHRSSPYCTTGGDPEETTKDLNVTNPPKHSHPCGPTLFINLNTI